MRIESISAKDNLSFDDDDLCNRKPTGESLSDLVSNMPNGGVISLDGGWGEGKTTFIKMWLHQYQEHLGDSGKVIYFDAFERDYVEDPFLPIVACLLEASEMGLKNKKREAARDFTKKLQLRALKTAQLFAISALKNGVANVSGGLVTRELIDKVWHALSLKAKSALDAALKSQLDEYKQHDQSIREFKESLIDWVGEYGPVVFIVDELDRCKPTFAVSLFERLKHFFDVPGIVFVLVMNRGQLEHAVNGLYGSRIDAERYISKFINYSCDLPRAVLAENAERVTHFVARSLGKLNVAGSTSTEDISTEDIAVATALVASVFSLSVREVETLCSELAVILRRQPKMDSRWFVVVPLLCVIRWRERDLFDVLQEVEPSNATEAGELCRQKLHHRFMPFLEEARSFPYRLLITIFFRNDKDTLARLIPDSHLTLEVVHSFSMRIPDIERAVVNFCRRIAQP